MSFALSLDQTDGELVVPLGRRWCETRRHGLMIPCKFGSGLMNYHFKST